MFVFFRRTVVAFCPTFGTEDCKEIFAQEEPGTKNINFKKKNAWEIHTLLLFSDGWIDYKYEVRFDPHWTESEKGNTFDLP